MLMVGEVTLHTILSGVKAWACLFLLVQCLGSRVHPGITSVDVAYWPCGGVEDVISVLTLVRRGVAQVFHVLLVELRLQLVVEVGRKVKK